MRICQTEAHVSIGPLRLQSDLSRGSRLRIFRQPHTYEYSDTILRKPYLEHSSGHNRRLAVDSLATSINFKIYTGKLFASRTRLSHGG